MLWLWCIYELALTYICGSMVSVKTFEGVNNDFNDAKNDCDGVLAFKDTEKSEIREENMLCGKIDEEGWQCGKVVKNGENVCEDHIIELKKHTVQAAKKEAQPVHGSLAGSGPRNTKKRVLANRYDQVYY